MRPEQDPMMNVRADLCERLESLRRLAERCSTRDFLARVDAIRTLAAAYGLTPVVRLAQALEQSILRDSGRSHGTGQASLYLSRLQDAIGCERLDEEASQVLLASVSVRLCA
jgi:hypothetical protein